VTPRFRRGAACREYQLSRPRPQPPDRRQPAAVLAPVKGRAFGGAEEAPSLTAATRDGDGNMRSRRKNARGAGRTKEWNDKGGQKWRDPHSQRKPHISRIRIRISVIGGPNWCLSGRDPSSSESRWSKPRG
jgi:hypothetical protein